MGGPPWVSKSSFWYSAHLGCAGDVGFALGSCVQGLWGMAAPPAPQECQRDPSGAQEGVRWATESLVRPFVCSGTGDEWKVKQKGKESKQFQQAKN